MTLIAKILRGWILVATSILLLLVSVAVAKGLWDWYTLSPTVSPTLHPSVNRLLPTITSYL